jgi:hypothetical protein
MDMKYEWAYDNYEVHTCKSLHNSTLVVLFLCTEVTHNHLYKYTHSMPNCFTAARLDMK